MKILLIMSGINYSGASKMLVWLANKLVDEGNMVNIVTVYEKAKNQEIDSRIKVSCLDIDLSMNRIIRNTIQLMNVSRKLINYMKKNKFDVVITFGDTPGIIVLLLKRLLNVKVIVSERADPYTKKSSMDDFRRKLFGLADGIVFQTENAKEYFNNSIKEKSIVIPNPVVNKKIPEKFNGIRENKIVSVGRLEIVQKRQDLLIEAFDMINDNFPEVELFIYGDGENKEELETLVKRKNLLNKVKFPGATDNVYEVIKRAKLFVLTSDFEGIPNALIEAMSVGMPVISTDCSPGGAKMLIDNYKNGILVPCGDKEELSKAIRYILDNSERAEQMGKNALNILTTLNEEKIFSEWNRFIKSHL
ncbi:glycosyltransferase [Clostridium perfringens]|nr:glycosyltransferase [Clostridium perfringens]